MIPKSQTDDKEEFVSNSQRMKPHRVFEKWRAGQIKVGVYCHRLWLACRRFLFIWLGCYHHLSRRPSLFNPISCVSRLIYAVFEAKREKEIIINRRAELVPFAPDRLTLFTPPVAIRWPKPFFHQDIRRHASRPAGHLTKHPLNTTTSSIRDKTIVQ